MIALIENRCKAFLLLASLLMLGVAGCSVPEMKVSQGMQQDTTTMPVVGRSFFRFSLGKEKGFGFGPFQLQDIRRGWTNRRDMKDESLLQVSEAYQKYSFGLTDTVQQKNWFVQAAAMLNAETIQVGGWSVNMDKQREFLQVAFRSPESGEWRLSLADPGNYLQRNNFIGKLSNGSYEIEVHPLYKWEGKSFTSGTALGYEFSREGHVLASVQTINTGKVWMKNTLSPDIKMVLASACASLLLYNKLDEANQ